MTLVMDCFGNCQQHECFAPREAAIGIELVQLASKVAGEGFKLRFLLGGVFRIRRDLGEGGFGVIAHLSEQCAACFVLFGRDGGGDGTGEHRIGADG